MIEHGYLALKKPVRVMGALLMGVVAKRSSRLEETLVRCNVRVRIRNQKLLNVVDKHS